MPADKLQPRNRTARLADARAAGNPVVTELEAGVGNCFPGLEADLRNLERRFFPYLVVEFVRGRIAVAAVDLQRATTDGVTGALLTGLTSIADAGGDVQRLAGTFAGHGQRDYAVASLGTDAGDPVDPWTAVRLLVPGSTVTLTVRVPGSAQPVMVSAPRASYLSDDGAFAAMFEPGELTQSLCSPWTHDFRDCGCFYWASNHPDIAQPPLPPAADPGDPDFAVRVGWLRSDRLTSPPPVVLDRVDGVMDHNEINDRWQELDVVLDGREQRTAYAPTTVAGAPLDRADLVPTLRYAAGVELAVMLEYLAAAYSVDVTAGAANSALRQDVRAARYEVLRVAASEMRHLKAVNGLLLDEHESSGAAGPFVPALGVATVVPEPGGVRRPVAFRPLTPEVLEHFVQVEAPSQSVDALYGRILATYQRDGQETQAATVGQVMAEGADHYRTFRTLQEWLGRHPVGDYLLTLDTPAEGDAVLATLQQRYATVLGHLHDGYRVGVPAGGAAITAARAAMLGPNGVEGACVQLAAGGSLPVFAVPPTPDGRFDPVAPLP